MCVEMVLGTSSIIKRQTASKLLEEAYNMYRELHMDTDGIVLYKNIKSTITT